MLGARSPAGVPALEISHEPALIERLVEFARKAGTERGREVGGRCVHACGWGPCSWVDQSRVVARFHAGLLAEPILFAGMGSEKTDERKAQRRCAREHNLCRAVVSAAVGTAVGTAIRESTAIRQGRQGRRCSPWRSPTSSPSGSQDETL